MTVAQYIEALTANVSAFYDDRLCYEDFTKRQRELWAEIEERPRVCARVLAHWRQATAHQVST